MVAQVVAQQGIFSDVLDVVFVMMLQLVQIINASWRASLTDADDNGRRGAAAIMQLAASILGPLFQMVKPLDPKTKYSKVVSLYLHAPIARTYGTRWARTAPLWPTTRTT